MSSDLNRRCWDFTVEFFSHLLGLLALMSRFSTAPTYCMLRTFKHSHETPHYEVFLAVESVLCRDHYKFTPCHCYHGKERKSSVYTASAAISLCCLHILCCHGDHRNEHDCTLHQTCRKGRRDVLPPTTAFTLLCHRLSTSASPVHFTGAHVKASATTQQREIPASGVYWTSAQSGVLIAKCHLKVFLIAQLDNWALTGLTFCKKFCIPTHCQVEN